MQNDALRNVVVITRRLPARYLRSSFAEPLAVRLAPHDEVRRARSRAFKRVLGARP
jgi:hypothetical protein